MTIWNNELMDLEILYQSIKDSFPGIERELSQLLKTEDPNVILLYSRRCLEIIITDLCECELKRPRRTEPLQGIIDKLNKEEKVPSHIIAAMHGLNTLSTFGTHPKDFEPEQVKPVLINLGIIIKWFVKYKGIQVPVKSDKTVKSNLGKPVILRKSLTQKKLSWKTIVPSVIIIFVIIFSLPQIIKFLGNYSQAGPDTIQSVAVMPVLDFTGDPGLAWIPEMLQNDLTGQLQGISTLIVRPRQTTLQFRNSDESVQEIAQKLKVNSLIEASIKGTEDNLQVDLRVIEAFPEEKYLYSSSFNQSFKELTNTYGEIINDILKHLKINTSEKEEESIAARKVNPEVRKACARGAYYMNQLTDDGVEQGIKYYKEAISIDPADPEPYIGLALGYSGAGHAAGIASHDLAKAYALKAIELDPEELHPDLADAHVVLAEVYLYSEYDFIKAEHHLKRAISINPNSAPAHYTYGWYLVLTNQVDEAASHMKKSIEIDPLNPFCTGYLAWLYQWAGRFPDALHYVDETLKIDPDYPMALYVQGIVYSETGRHDEAIEIQKKIYSPESGFANGLGVAYAFAGQKENALKVASEMEQQNMDWHTWGLAGIYAILGEKDKAMYWIEQAYEKKHDFIPWMKYNRYCKDLVSDPRFQKIVKQLNLPG